MSASLRYDITDTVTPLLERLGGRLRDRRELNEWIAGDLLKMARDHFEQNVLPRHKSAESLGATPTNFWGTPSRYTSQESDADSATVAIRHPGIRRAVEDVEIKPTEGEWLTIPIHREAYGRRAYRMRNLFFVQPKGKDYALLGKRQPPKGRRLKGRDTDYNESGDGIASANGRQTEWMYLLVHEVLQKQDRTLLPPDDEILKTAKTAARGYFKDALVARAEAGGAA